MLVLSFRECHLCQGRSTPYIGDKLIPPWTTGILIKWVYQTLVDEFIPYHRKTTGLDWPDRTYRISFLQQIMVQWKIGVSQDPYLSNILIWKICSSNWIISPSRGENNKIFFFFNKDSIKIPPKETPTKMRLVEVQIFPISKFLRSQFFCSSRWWSSLAREVPCRNGRTLGFWGAGASSWKPPQLM